MACTMSAFVTLLAKVRFGSLPCSMGPVSPVSVKNRLRVTFGSASAATRSMSRGTNRICCASSSGEALVAYRKWISRGLCRDRIRCEKMEMRGLTDCQYGLILYKSQCLLDTNTACKQHQSIYIGSFKIRRRPCKAAANSDR